VEFVEGVVLGVDFGSGGDSFLAAHKIDIET
jgi:hypothetical protein